MLGVPLGELAVLAAAIVVGGVVTGLLAGLFGVGGGAVIVPVLYEVFRILGVPEDVRMQLCVGTSLAIIVPTSLLSFLAHRAKGSLPVEIIRAWAPPMIAGIAVGAVTAAFAPSWVFKLAFVVVTSLVALRMFLVNDRWRLGDALPGQPAMSGYGLVVGLYSGLMGVGGGSVSTLILMLYGTAIHTAVGISAGVGVVISVTGTIGYLLAGIPYHDLLPPLSVGYVSLIGVAIMAPVSSYAAPFGARLAHRMPKRKLEIAFGVFLLAVAVRFLFSLL
ncbi:MAG: sulfite exporter TauE/SafE family protein [Alphaproteobacteria bacterium]|nr:sulfite exporter TauE/SafE family protein [Alphaproteobacteria bacterium]